MALSEFNRRWGSDVAESPEEGAREKYLGPTPGKASDTGRTLIRGGVHECAANANSWVGADVEVEWAPGKWHDLADCDMSHDPVDAVDYWLDVARPLKYPPRGREVREWMKDWRNYILEPAAVNRSRGSRQKRRYLPP